MNMQFKSGNVKEQNFLVTIQIGNRKILKFTLKTVCEFVDRIRI
jgi:hypothetical protein